MSLDPRRELDNPFFARFYKRNRKTADRRGELEHRRRVLDGLHGRVVELGAGDGANFPHFPQTALLEMAERSTIWPRLAGGCHPNRDTERAIRDAGFQIESCERFRFSPSVVSPRVPHILGVARPPA